jgi:hypothetical protein
LCITPGGSFFDYWLFTILLYLEVMGIANLIAVIFPVRGRILVANGFLVVLWAFGGVNPTQSELKSRLGWFGWILNHISPFKWPFEFQVIVECNQYSPAYRETIDFWITLFGYSSNHYRTCVASMVLHAIAWNSAAVLWLLWAKDDYRHWRHLTEYVASFFKKREKKAKDDH